MVLFCFFSFSFFNHSFSTNICHRKYSEGMLAQMGGCGTATRSLREGRYINDSKIKESGRIRRESLSSWDFGEWHDRWRFPFCRGPAVCSRRWEGMRGLTKHGALPLRPSLCRRPRAIYYFGFHSVIPNTLRLRRHFNAYGVITPQEEINRNKQLQKVCVGFFFFSFFSFFKRNGWVGSQVAMTAIKTKDRQPKKSCCTLLF